MVRDRSCSRLVGSQRMTLDCALIERGYCEWRGASRLLVNLRGHFTGLPSQLDSYFRATPTTTLQAVCRLHWILSSGSARHASPRHPMANPDVPHRGIATPADGLSAARVAFPQSEEDFDNDPRVSFSRLENKHILEDDDGSEWEFDNVRKRWIPSVRPRPQTVDW